MTEDREPTHCFWHGRQTGCECHAIVAAQPASHIDLDRALTASGFPSTVEQPASHIDQRAAIDYAVHLMEEAFEGAAPVHAVAIRRHIEVITSLSEQPALPLDVERLARAIHASGDPHDPVSIAAEYERLARDD